MGDFWEGFLFGLVLVGCLIAIVLPLVLVVFSPLWLLLYLIEIPILGGLITLTT